MVSLNQAIWRETNDSYSSCYQNAIYYAFASLKECPFTQQHMFLDESIVT